jgi:tetratricopeptide (TPR) repeat protein
LEAAVRHIVRHLDDATALQRNPLTSRFFDRAPSGEMTPEQRAAAHERVRSLVLLAAERFRDSSTSPDERERRSRQFAIVRDHVVEKKAPRRLARELGISVRQYYRERAEIYRSVGTFIAFFEPVLEPGCLKRISEFEFQMERAAARVEAGDFDRAMRAYRDVAACAAAPQKAEALCAMADVELELGKFSAADRRLRELEVLLAAEPTVTEPRLARSRVDWLRAKHAWETGDFDQAAQRTTRARTSLARIPDGSLGFKALRIEMDVESALRALDRGEFAAAQRHLDEAATICGDDPALNFSSLDLSFARMALDGSRLRPGDDRSMREYVRLSNRAMEAAARSGSMKRMLTAAAFQVRHRSPREHAPLEVARVLAMAHRFPNKRLAAVLSAMLADYLLQGPHWRMAGRLLCGSLPQRSFLWAVLMHLRSVYLLRIGDAFAARKCARLAFGVARRAGNPRLHATTLRGLAMSAHFLAREKEAADYIEAAVPLAEQHGSSTSCLRTYEYAALITRQPKYARAAEKLRLAVT